MSRFLVDSRSLLGVRDTLGRLHDQLLGMHTVVGGFDGLLGSRALEAELGQFCATWHFGIVEISGQIADMMERLAAAAAAYRQIEEHLRHGMAPVSGSGTTVIRPVTPHRPQSGSGTTVIG